MVLSESGADPRKFSVSFMPKRKDFARRRKGSHVSHVSSDSDFSDDEDIAKPESAKQIHNKQLVLTSGGSRKFQIKTPSSEWCKLMSLPKKPTFPIRMQRSDENDLYRKSGLSKSQHNFEMIGIIEQAADRFGITRVLKIYPKYVLINKSKSFHLKILQDRVPGDTKLLAGQKMFFHPLSIKTSKFRVEVYVNEQINASIVGESAPSKSTFTLTQIGESQIIEVEMNENVCDKWLVSGGTTWEHLFEILEKRTFDSDVNHEQLGEMLCGYIPGKMLEGDMENMHEDDLKRELQMRCDLENKSHKEMLTELSKRVPRQWTFKGLQDYLLFHHLSPTNFTKFFTEGELKDIEKAIQKAEKITHNQQQDPKSMSLREVEQDLRKGNFPEEKLRRMSDKDKRRALERYRIKAVFDVFEKTLEEKTLEETLKFFRTYNVVSEDVLEELTNEGEESLRKELLRQEKKKVREWLGRLYIEEVRKMTCEQMRTELRRFKITRKIEVLQSIRFECGVKMITFENKPEAGRFVSTTTAGTSLEIGVESLGISLVGLSSATGTHGGRRPQELLNITLNKIHFEQTYTRNIQNVSFWIKEIQIDNQMRTTIMPILVAFKPHRGEGLRSRLSQVSVDSQIDCDFGFSYAKSREFHKTAHFESFEVYFRAIDISLDGELLDELVYLSTVLLPSSDKVTLSEHDLEADIHASTTFGIGSSLQHKGSTSYMYFRKLHLPRLRLSFRYSHSRSIEGVGHTPSAVVRHAVLAGAFNIGKAVVRVNSRSIEDIYTSQSLLMKMISQHYTKNIKKQAGNILGHSLLIGDPLGLADHIARGFHVLLSTSLRTNPKEWFHNVWIFACYMCFGPFEMLRKLTYSLGVIAATSTMDGRYITAHNNKMLLLRPMHIGSGLYLGLARLTAGLWGGLSGVVIKPVQGAREKTGIERLKGASAG